MFMSKEIINDDNNFLSSMFSIKKLLIIFH